jgi:CubicO group peptidase (beta-lactamase class C family)
LIINSKEHIFDPLGMKTSFFLPNLRERAVNLAYRDAKGTLHPWDNQLEIIEQDLTKGMLKNFSNAGPYGGGLIFALVSSCFSRRSRVILLYEGLPQAPPSLDADPWYA